MNNNAIQTCDTVKHFGILLNANRKNTNAIEDAIRGRNLFIAYSSVGVLYRELNPLVSVKLYNSVVIPSLLYGSKTWCNLSKTDTQKIDKFQKYIRLIICKRVRR